MVKRKRKIWKRVALWIALACVVVALVCDTIVRQNVNGRAYDDIDSLPHNKVGLLLGTSPLDRQGNKNLYFIYRIDAAEQLVKAGKIDYILISGDNSTEGYDEPTWMRDSLVARGVPEDRIVLDFAGFRTLDSVVRAKEIFGQDSFTIISQQFHNERAIYLADLNGIDAVAYNAKDVTMWQKWLKIHGREYLARVKMMIDIAVNKQPHFLGEKIEIE
jgi:SanA protein